MLRTGIAGKGVLQMADELLQLKNDSGLRNVDGGFGGISGLLNANADDLKRVKGLGPAKRAEIVAVLELARRAMAQQLQERTVFADPEAIRCWPLWQFCANNRADLLAHLRAKRLISGRVETVNGGWAKGLLQ